LTNNFKDRSINENEWEKEWLNELTPIPDSEDFGDIWLKVADEMGINVIRINKIEEFNDGK
tara:strand:+ start:178 stop:360 length:183 start_codon:yes stop_codon:yes gene_type:complete